MMCVCAEYRHPNMKKKQNKNKSYNEMKQILATRHRKHRTGPKNKERNKKKEKN